MIAGDFRSRVIAVALLLSLVLVAPVTAAAPVNSSTSTLPAIPDDYNCISCHTDMEDETITPPVGEWKSSVHREVGVFCADCHGGNPHDEDLAMDPDAGFIGKPEPQDIPQLCAKCHSDGRLMRKYNQRADQLLLYSGSVHGRKLAKGDTAAPSCVSCHGKHDIRRVKDPTSTVHRNNITQTCGGCHANKKLFDKRRKPSDQLVRYKKSRHHELLVQGNQIVPTCKDCHGNHSVLPASSEHTRTVCFSCHNAQAERFKASPHYKAFLRDGEPVCLSCHLNHDVLRPNIEKFTGDGDSDCGACHEKSEKAYRVAFDMKAIVNKTMIALASATSALERLKNDGHGGFDMSGLEVILEKAAENLAELHTLTHTLNVESVKQESTKIIRVATMVNKKVDEFWNEIETRKIGLTIAWIIFLSLTLALIYWTKTVEQQRNNRP